MECFEAINFQTGELKV